MKKFLTLFLIFILSLTSAFLLSCGEKNPTGLKFEKVKGGYSVAGIGSCKDYKINIPTKYNGEPVVAISDEAFAFGEGVIEFVIPSSVTKVGKKAFYANSHLKEITFENGVEEIGEQALALCTSLKSVTFGETVKSIGDKAFYDCDRISEAILPNSLETIGEQAFASCDLLENVTFGTGLAYIGVKAFFECKNISEVVIPDGAPTFIDTGAFQECRGIRYVTIGNDVNFIGNYAFEMCNHLIKATVGDGVNFIGEYAFSRCRNLVTITIGSNVKDIYTAAFSGCYKLFDVCNKSLMNFTSGTGNQGYVARYAMNIYKNPADTKISFENDGSILFEHGEKVYFMGHTTNKTIDLVIPDKVTDIAWFACYNNTYVNSLTVGKNLKTIGDQAFQFAYTLRRINCIGVENIKKGAFGTCNKLVYVTIGNSLKTIESGAFSGCKSIYSVSFKGTNEEYASIAIDTGNDYFTSANKILI